MPKRYLSARNIAFRCQGERCHWCQEPMWLGDPSAYMATHHLTRRQAKRFQCTVEHLVAQRDGGAHGTSNVVAACRHCNLTRHTARVSDPAPPAYRKLVSSRMQKRKWHPAWAPAV